MVTAQVLHSLEMLLRPLLQNSRLLSLENMMLSLELEGQLRGSQLEGTAVGRDWGTGSSTESPSSFINVGASENSPAVPGTGTGTGLPGPVFQDPSTGQYQEAPMPDASPGLHIEFDPHPHQWEIWEEFF